MQSRHVVKVWSKLPTIAHGNFHEPRFGQLHFAEPGNIFAQVSFELLVPPLERLKLYKQRAIRGMQVANTRILELLDGMKQSDHPTVGGERNFISQSNEEGRIAGGRSQGCKTSRISRASKQRTGIARESFLPRTRRLAHRFHALNANAPWRMITFFR